MGSRRWEEEMRKYPFWYFSDDQLWLFNFHPISQNWNILISTHPIVKLKIVLESLGLGEDMVKKQFSYFDFFTSGNPCDSSPPSRRNHEPETPEKFSKHGFSFFNPNIPLSLETWTKWKIGCLFHQNPHLNSKNHFWQKSKIFLRKIEKTQLSLSKLSFDKKYWLNFLDLPFSNRHWRPKPRLNLAPEVFFPSEGI